MAALTAFAVAFGARLGWQWGDERTERPITIEEATVRELWRAGLIKPPKSADETGRRL
ncbi:hypothetical protein GCM10007301_15150 [Azorhizobium oxalatiphilum]|uniref:Uncharacterized protein n=2 Tax=Azorhizobium oxalatiphilum TaxID=980631 RepID=A0A917F8G3_9HYPH|nr:hypothetical protein GCM10007301_15150 [Azorhizobium oxalatiphilum]